MLRTGLAALLAASLLLAAAPAGAQAAPAAGDEVVVTLTSGATFRGTLVGQTERSLQLRSAAGTVRELPLGSVRQVAPVAPVVAPSTAAGTPAGEPAASASPAPAAALQPAAPAATASAPDQVHAGLGVSLQGSGASPIFYLPVQINRSLRLEPELGFLSAESGGTKVSGTWLGLGLLGTSEVAPQVGAYGGLRLELSRFAATGASEQWNSRFAAVVGAEWQPVSRVALGVEVQAAYANVDVSIDGSSATGFGTAGLLFLRIYAF